MNWTARSILWGKYNYDLDGFGREREKCSKYSLFNE